MKTKFSRSGGRVGRRFAYVAVSAGLAAGLTACGSSSSGSSGSGGSSGASGSSGGSSGGSSKGPIVIGIAAGKTGALSPYDLQPGQAFQLHMDEINKAGGIMGRQVKVEWIDTKSDKTTAASVATQEIQDGAVAILTTCDFDYGSPAAFQAAAKKVPAISLCASSPKNATPAIIGKYGFSMGFGSDTEGVTAAEWIHQAHPSWKRAYVLRDTSLEYSKAVADYFTARWKQLGGQIVGEDNFVGGQNADLSSQVSRLQSHAGSTDFVMDASWNPAGSVAVRQIRSAGINLPIISDQSVDGTLTTQVAGPVSNYFSEPVACVPSYCSGGTDPAADKFASDFKAKYGQDLANSYPVHGWDLATVLKAAIEKAHSTNGDAMVNAMETMGPIQGLTSTFHFSAQCHRPIGAAHLIVKWMNGKAQFVAKWAVKQIPNIGDSNPCAGNVS